MNAVQDMRVAVERGRVESRLDLKDLCVLVSTAILLSEGYIVETFIQGCIWGPLSTGGHYPRVDLGATIQGWALSKGGSGGHYPRVATIQGWPLSKGGSWVHYPRVATIQVWIWGPLSKGGHKWQLLSKALLNIREATWTLSSQGDQRAPIENLCIDVHIACIVCKHA